MTRGDGVRVRRSSASARSSLAAASSPGTPSAPATRRMETAMSASRSLRTTSSGTCTAASARETFGWRPAALAMTRSGFSATIFSTSGCTPPTLGSDFARAGSSEKSSVPTTRSPAPTAKMISVTLGARETTRLGNCWTEPSGRAQARRKRSGRRRLALAALFIFQVIGHAEAGAGGGVHLLGGVDRVLQLRNAVLHLGQLFFDLILQIRDLLLRDLKRGLVELLLLIGDDRHSSRSSPAKCARIIA